MDPLWTIPLVGLVVAVFAGIVALLDYLGSNSRQIPAHRRA
jgi:hypothetical protein